MNKNQQTVKEVVERAKNQKGVSPLKAIRAKCLDCTCYQSSEVRLCPSKDCPLWYFRFGRNKSRKPSKARVEAGKRLSKFKRS